MNPQDPLAALHPLRESGVAGWWPPAPGWWILLGLLLLVLAVILWRFLRRYRANAYRRRALSRLQELHENYLRDQDAGAYLAAANALLKSVALVAYPRRDVAASHGEDWRQFLNGGIRRGEVFEPGFALAAYRPQCPDLDLEQLNRAASNWITRHEAMQ